MQKCKRCGAPLEGFLYKTIGKLMGIKPSEKDPEICNKCEEEAPEENLSSQGLEQDNTSQSAEQKTEETSASPASQAEQPAEQVPPQVEFNQPADSSEQDSSSENDESKQS